jgi:hypothetical protein
MKTFLFFILSLLPLHLLKAQDTTIISKCPDWSIVAHTGGLLTNFDDLNNTLRENHIKPFDEDPLFWSVLIKRSPAGKKFDTHIGFRWMRGLRETALDYNPGNSAYTNRTLRSAGLVYGFDFYVVNKERFRLFPSLNIEANRTVLKIYEDVPVGTTLSNSITSGLHTKKYTTWKTMPGLELQAEFLIPIFSYYTTVGLSAGYNLDFNSDWNYEDDLPVAFPGFKWSGFQFAITIGMEIDCQRLQWYIEKDEKKKKL